jgi:hypothetical protein
MKSRTTRAILFTAVFMVLSVIAIGNTWAANHFTFKVPVRLYSINSAVPFIYINCYVSKVGLNHPHPASAANVVGRDKTKLPISASGNVSKVVTVAFNAKPGRNPASAKTYTCYMTTDIGHSMNVATQVGGTYFKEKFRRKPGAAFVWKVKGNL